MNYPDGYHILSAETIITSQVHVQWAPRTNRWSQISANSPFLGKTPTQVHRMMEREIVFGFPMLEGEKSQAIVLDRHALSICISGAKTQAEYLIAIYKLVHPDFEHIKQFRGYPVCTQETWKTIALACSLKDAEINRSRDITKQLLEGGCWMNSGFSCCEVPDGLRHMMVIPCADTDLEYDPAYEAEVIKI